MSQDTITTGVASVGVVNEFLLQNLDKDISITLTILGCIWLVLQIYYKIKNKGHDQ